MATGVSYTGPRTLTVPKAWETPQILWAGLWGIWILDGLLLLVLILGAQMQRDILQTIGRHGGPSIIHAQHIKTALADMDAKAASELLAAPGQAEDAKAIYERRRTEAAEALIDAARNITYGDAEKKPILRIQTAMGKYEALVQRARDLHLENNPAAAASYADAASLMDDGILKAADDLDVANLYVLEGQYESGGRRSALMRGVIVVTGLTSLGMLILIQAFMTQRMKRLINPPLAIATVLTFGFLIFSLAKLGDSRHQLKVAREDAFPSIHALWQAKAAAYSSNADESRYLLDKAQAQKWLADSQQKRDRIAKMPPGQTEDSMADSSLNARDDEKARFTGYLADELNNITFENEREAAVRTLRAFGVYNSIDRSLQAFEENGNHAKALLFWLRNEHNQAIGAFDPFDIALDETLKINQQQFVIAVDKGFADLDGLEVKGAILAALVAGLALYGALQRIREYR